MKTDIEKIRDELSRTATKNQRDAANPQKSVWVGASAGTGKTKVLTDRVLRLLLAGNDPSKMLCLTYTKAAAVEMSTRVSKRLGEWAIMPDEKLEEELGDLYGDMLPKGESLRKLKARARQLFAILADTPGGVKIQTIHSFCQEILKRFPLEAGVSPYFEVMDDRNALEAVNNVKSDIVRYAADNPDSEIGKAVQFFTANISENNFAKIIEAIIKERSKIEQIVKDIGSKQNLLKSLSEKLNIADDLTLEDILKEFFARVSYDDLRKLEPARKDEISAWLASDRSLDDYEKYLLIFLTKDNETRNVSRIKVLNGNPDLAKIFVAEGKRCEELVQKIKSFNVYQSTKAIILLASELIEGYNTFKRKHAKMDYNDMILLTRNLLKNKENAAQWVLFKLDGGIDNILIDEAQDTSPDQWAIIDLISNEFFAGKGSTEKKRTVFAVGDRKQSIFSFQGADPDKFDKMREHFEKLDDDFEKVDLKVSFRSVPTILAVVDKLFEKEKVYDGVSSKGEKIEHRGFREGEAGEVEFWEMIDPEDEKKSDEWRLPTERFHGISTPSQMAQTIASRISKMVRSGEILPSKQRAVRYGDFLILVRSRDALCEEIIRECKNLKINIAGIDRIKLMEQIAVQDLVSLGKFLLLPEDDLSLAEVLKSPLFGLDDEDLYKLCYKREGSLWSSLQKHKEYGEIVKELEKLFKRVDFDRPFELYNRVLGQMGGRKKFYSRLGPEVEDGLDEFINLSQSFEQGHIPTLQNFIEWVTSDDVEIKRDSEQGNNDMVRIMTVHGSKGLQAPIVILPDTTGVPKCNREGGFLWDEKMFVYPTESANYDEFCDKLKAAEKLKVMEEYRRLLYVAVTRAEDRMIFCGYRKKKKAAEDSWYYMFKDSFTQIAVPDESQKSQKVWKYCSEQKFVPEKKADDKYFYDAGKIPDFMFRPALEEKPLSKPLTPSKPEGKEPAAISPLTVKDDEKFYKRGLLIHKLLQFLPDVAPENREAKAREFLLRKVSKGEAEEIVEKVKNLFDNEEYGEVFGSDSKAEIPVMGEVNGKIISGQIDRLLIGDRCVIIVDFKTNRHVPREVPPAYRAQLAAYKALLQKIYPQKEIKTYILWTNNAQISEVV